MYYDDSTRRRNLLRGIALGTLLGAGLALLFLPEERLHAAPRVVVRAVRRLRPGAGHREAASTGPRARSRRRFEL
jgi:hypothetical protein